MLLNLAEVGRIIVLDKFESDTKSIIKDTKGNFASGGNMTICLTYVTEYITRTILR